ncbi:hypothetical protein ABIE45_001018 [Methylobacterium sp. OAE515]
MGAIITDASSRACTGAVIIIGSDAAHATRDRRPARHRVMR